MRDAGSEVELFYASRLDVKPCACGQMYRWYDSPGECCIRDDMETLYPRLKEAHTLVLATPVYLPLPGEMENVLNRLCPLLDPSLRFARDARGPGSATTFGSAGSCSSPRLGGGRGRIWQRWLASSRSLRRWPGSAIERRARNCPGRGSQKPRAVKTSVDGWDDGHLGLASGACRRACCGGLAYSLGSSPAP